MWYLLRFPNGGSKKIEGTGLLKGKILWIRKPADELVTRDGFLSAGGSYDPYRITDKFDILEETVNGQIAELSVCDLEKIDERPELSPGG